MLMRTTKSIASLTLSLILFVLLAGTVCAEITNRIVASVNNDIITLWELNASIKRLTGLTPKDLQLRNEKKFYELRRTVLNEMINEKIAEQEIAKLQLTVTDEDVQASIERVKEDNNLTQEQLIASLKAEGTSFEEYKERVRKDIERARLVNHEVRSKIVVTDEDIRRYHENNAQEYRQFHELRLARIFLRVRDPDNAEEIARVRTAGRKILQELNRGGDFFQMARKYSQGPAAPEGGDLGWIALDQVETELRETIAKLSPGEYTDLHPAPSGFQIIRVVDEKKGGVTPLAEVRDEIYSKVFKKKVEEKYAAWIKELREKSYIKVIF
jgi:peptidyl-prolyl cis-trans isomerase SurA